MKCDCSRDKQNPKSKWSQCMQCIGNRTAFFNESKPPHSPMRKTRHNICEVFQKREKRPDLWQNDKHKKIDINPRQPLIIYILTKKVILFFLQDIVLVSFLITCKQTIVVKVVKSLTSVFASCWFQIFWSELIRTDVVDNWYNPLYLNELMATHNGFLLTITISPTIRWWLHSNNDVSSSHDTKPVINRLLLNNNTDLINHWCCRATKVHCQIKYSLGSCEKLHAG